MISATIRALAAACLLVATSAEAGPLRHGSNTPYAGYIESGGKFGIRIGASMEEVRKTLTDQGLRYDGPSHCESYPKEVLDCDPSETWEIYRVQQFLRDGDIFVRYDNGRAVVIAWSFTLLPEVDM